MRLHALIGIVLVVAAAYAAPVSSAATELRLPNVEIDALVPGPRTTMLALGDDKSRGLVLRLRSDGSVDSSFGSKGMALEPGAKEIGWENAAVLPNGNVVAAGTDHFGRLDAGSDAAMGSHLILAMLDARGRVSSGFGHGGYVVASSESCLRGPTNIVSSGGRIVVAALHWCRDKDPRTIQLLAFTTRGTPASSFGTNGVVSIGTVGAETAPKALLLTTSAGVLVAAPTGPPGTFSLTRVLATGVVDSSFGNKGTVTTTLGSPGATTQLDTMFTTRGAHVSVAGCAQSGPFAARFNANGSPYAFFVGAIGSATSVETFGGAFGARCASFAQLRDHDVAAAGSVLASLLPDGLLDPRHPFIRLPKIEAPWHPIAVKSDGTLFVSSKVGNWRTVIDRYR